MVRSMLFQVIPWHIQNLLEKWSIIIYRLSRLVELPFLVRSLVYDVILWLDSESPWKMVHNDVQIILFGWISFFWLAWWCMMSSHDQIQNLLEKWSIMIYRSSYLDELPFLIRSLIYDVIPWPDSESPWKWCIMIYRSSYLDELPFLVRSLIYIIILLSDSESPWKMVYDDI